MSKINTFSIKLFFFLSLVLFLMSSCEERVDDLNAIFLNKTWHLTYSPDAFDGMFETAEAKLAAVNTMNNGSNCTIVFQGATTDGIIQGTFSVQGTNTKAEGTWRANGETNEMRMEFKGSLSTDSSPIVREMMNCIAHVRSYRGDVNNLLLYYTGGKTSFLGFTPKK